MDEFIKYDTTTELHRELTNVLLLCLDTDESYFYCYCGEEFGDCDLCGLIEFFANPFEENFIDGLYPREFLKRNYNNRDKLEEFSLKILPYFQKMKMNQEKCLEFFQQRYYWSTRDRNDGTTHSMTLEEVIENDIEMIEQNFLDR